MEKIVSVEERIRRAEEIYNRRNSINESARYTYREPKEKRKKNKNYKIIKKMLVQIFVCFLIYAIFYVISNSNYIFSEDFRNSVNSVLTKETDFNKIYNDVKNYIYQALSTKDAKNVDNYQENSSENAEKTSDGNVTQNSSLEKSSDENLTQDNNQDENQDNIGGAIEESISTTESETEESQKEKSQMEIDADDIKSSISFIVPVQGTISSTFGLRNPTTPTVPKNHTGLDIAASTGTVIKSATDGTVILASSEGDYGKHYKIQINDVIIIYAHCSQLYLKEGDKVTQGESIAEVGSTGNSTGPHLHFEIRKEDRLVDPQLILDI